VGLSADDMDKDRHNRSYTYGTQNNQYTMHKQKEHTYINSRQSKKSSIEFPSWHNSSNSAKQ